MAVTARPAADVPVQRTAGLIAGYRAVRGELDIEAALRLLGEQRSRRITVPRVDGEHLEFRAHGSADHAAAVAGSVGHCGAH